MSQKVIKMIKDNSVKYIDLRFTDTKGKEQHVSIPSREVNAAFFKTGKMFDGSSIGGWKGINESDMVLLPDASTAVMDPFFEDPTLILRCTVVEPDDFSGYDRDPRSLAARAEAYLKSTGIGDTAYFGPEPEFFVFDDVRWSTDNHSTFFHIDSEEADWNTGKKYDGGNLGHRPKIKGGYFPVPPVDSGQDLRSAMCNVMEDMGLVIEAHHHEVATAGQMEIATEFNTLVKKADEVQILKYVTHNVADAYGQTATFMPKPIVGDNGTGMHVHQSIAKKGKNIFSGKEYAGLSKEALWYIGGIIKHARALNAFTNASTNSYKRLVPGFEAPVMLAYSARNRSASIRIPVVPVAKATRVEVRFPDPTANPYLAFAAMLMAGIDGIKNKIDPGKPQDKDLYELSEKEANKIPTVAYSLEEALKSLDKDRKFLTEGGVFSNDFIDSYIALKMEDVSRVHAATHPAEFDMYYSV